MKNQNTIENLNNIRKMARGGNPVVLNMAITHLFSCGTDNFTEEAYASAVKTVEENHREAEANGTHTFMTLEFEKTLLDMAYQLSTYPLFDIFLYIKKDMEIHDPEAMEADEEDYTEEEM